MSNDQEIKDDTDYSLKSIIEDNSGGLSSIRVLMLVWGIGVLLVWSFSVILSIIQGNPIPVILTPEVVTILMGIVGIKTVQRPFEK